MTTWNLTSNVLTTTSPVTLKHTATGDCYVQSATGGAIPIYAVWIEVPATDTAASVQIIFEPGPDVSPIDDELVATTLVPAGHGGAHSWSPPYVAGVTTYSAISFPIPTSGTTWGWDFEPASLPPPLKMKVRIKRL